MVMVEARGVEPLSEKMLCTVSPSAAGVLNFASEASPGKVFVSYLDNLSYCLRELTVERPGLSDARTGLPGKVRIGRLLIKQRKRSYCWRLIDAAACLTRPATTSARFGAPHSPRRNQYAPIFNYQTLDLDPSPFAYSFPRNARSISRLASRDAISSRLSYSFLPLTSASSTLTFPRFK